MQPTHPRPSAAYVASLRRQQPPKPQGMCREPFPWNSTWPSSDSSASLMPKHATELRLVTNEDFFAVGQGPCGGTARCGPAGPCPCRFLANDLGTLCCSAPKPICCCARNLMGCLAYNCCCGVSRGVFTGLPEAAPCNPCCCFPCQCCSRHPPLQCGCPCDLVVCCKNPNDRCAALLFLAQRTLTAAAQHGQKLYPTAPGYPPEPNYPEGKAPATVGRVVPEEEQYFGFWDERGGGWVVPARLLLCGRFDCLSKAPCCLGVVRSCQWVVQLCGHGSAFPDVKPGDTVDNLPWEGAQPNRFTTAFEALADLLNSVPLLFCCVSGYYSCCVAKNVRWLPANESAGQSDSQMVQAVLCAKWGGVWIFPKIDPATGKPFSAPPTPCGTLDACGNPLPTNVLSDGEQEQAIRERKANGAERLVPTGNRVLVYLHGGAYASINEQAYIYITGLFLAEQTGQVVFMPEYPMDGTGGYPRPIDVIAPEYVKLMQLYGPNNVVMLGDSAGSNLILATVANATSRLAHGSPGVPADKTLGKGDAGGEPPAAMVLLSPWVGSVPPCGAL